MWNDLSAFITYKPITHSYVLMANKQRVPISGSGAIQIKINGFVLRMHNVFYITTLAFSLYSVKEHMKYGKYYTYFGNKKLYLAFPVLNLPYLMKMISM